MFKYFSLIFTLFITSSLLSMHINDGDNIPSAPPFDLIDDLSPSAPPMESLEDIYLRNSNDALFQNPNYQNTGPTYNQSSNNLVNYSDRLDFVDFEGNTVLHLAVQNGDYALTKLALQNFLDVNARNNREYTPIYYAVRNGDVRLVKLLFEYRPILNFSYKDQNILHVALQNENTSTEIIKALVACCPGLINEPFLGSLPLGIAIRFNKVNWVRALIESGVKLKMTEPDGTDLLREARSLGNLEIYNLILNAKSNKSYSNSKVFKPNNSFNNPHSAAPVYKQEETGYGCSVI